MIEKIGVVDLIYCPIKYHLMREYGRRTNELMELGKKTHEDFYISGYYKEVKVSKKVGNVEIIGVIDFYNHKDIIELKTYSKHFSLYNNYLQQLFLYSFLTGKKITKLLFYNPKSKKTYCYKFIFDNRAWKKAEIYIKNRIDNLIHRYYFPSFKWECKYCLYKKECKRWIKSEKEL